VVDVASGNARHIICRRFVFSRKGRQKIPGFTTV